MKEMKMQIGIPFQHVPSLKLAGGVSNAGPHPLLQHCVQQTSYTARLLPINRVPLKRQPKESQSQNPSCLSCLSLYQQDIRLHLFLLNNVSQLN